MQEGSLLAIGDKQITNQPFRVFFSEKMYHVDFQDISLLMYTLNTTNMHFILSKTPARGSKALVADDAHGQRQEDHADEGEH